MALTKYTVVINRGVSGVNYDGFEKTYMAKDTESLRKRLVAEYYTGPKATRPTFIDVFTTGKTGKRSLTGIMHVYHGQTKVSWESRHSIKHINPKTGKLEEW